MFFLIFIYMGRKESECLCIICNETDSNCFYKSRKNKCKSCMSNEYRDREDKEDYIVKQRKWRGENILHYRVESAKHRSKRHGIDFELTDEIVIQKIKEQNNLCYISKQPLSFKENDWNTLSLDRLDSNLGYTIENTIVVTKFVNNSKNNLSLDEYVTLIKLVCNNIITPPPPIT